MAAPGGGGEGQGVVDPGPDDGGQAKAECEEHERSHIPFRAWCREDQHASENGGDERAVQKITIIDYLDHDPSDESASPILEIRESKTVWLAGYEPWPAKVLAREIELSGFARVIVKSDGENPIKDLKNAASAIATTMHSMQCITEESPVGDSRYNGLSGETVRKVEESVRSLSLLAKN